MQDPPHDDVPAALARLAAACGAGALDGTGIELLVAHGSAARGEGAPGDLDLAVRCDDGLDLLAAIDLLADLAAPLPADRLDVMDLWRAGTLAAARALGTDCVPLHEQVPGTFAEAQVVALTRLMDHRWLLDAQLASLLPDRAAT